MPRTPSGGYNLPAGQPAVPDTLITAEVHNRLAQDMGLTLEDSLSRTGKGGMLVPFRVSDGSSTEPAYSFTNSFSSGMYFNSAERFLKFSVERSNILTLTENDAIVDGTMTADRVEGTSADDLSLTSDTNGLQVGSGSGKKLKLDTYQIQAVVGDSVSTLSLNPIGGDVLINGHVPAPDNDVYRKSEHIEVSLGMQSGRKPIILDGTGRIHPTLVDWNAFYFCDGWNPSAGVEYPNTSGHGAGAFWLVENLAGQYTFITGDLAGERCDNGYLMVYGTDGWALVYSNINPTAYYKLDGSSSITAEFQAGGYRLIDLADGVNPTDAVTMQQLGLQGDYYKLDGSAPITAPFQAGGFQMRNIADGTDGKDAVTVNQIDGYLPKDGTEKMTGSLTIGNGTTGFALYVRGNPTNEPRIRFKRADDTNAGGLRYDDATGGIGIERLDTIGTTAEAILLLDAGDDTLKYNGSQVFTEADHIEISAGSGDAGKPIILNQLGQIDSSMLDASTFYFVGEFTPVAGTEYPDTTGETAGAFWVVQGLGTGVEYTFAGGDLSGRKVTDGDFMVWSTGWSIMVGEMNPTLYYRLDGSQPLLADFEAGGNRLVNIADGTETTHAATVNQLNGYLPVDGKALDSEKLDGMIATDFVRSNDGSQEIQQGLKIEGAGQTLLHIRDSNAPADEKSWMIDNSNGELSIKAYNDSVASFVSALTFTRTGATIDTVEIGCPATINGSLQVKNGIDLTNDNANSLEIKTGAGVLRGLVGCTGAAGINDTFLRAYNNDGSGSAIGQLMISGSDGSSNFDKNVNVSGSLSVTGTIGATGAITSSGDVTAFSDRRVKKNFKKIDNALNKVQTLTGYTFDRSDIKTKRQTGLIAQEVKAVLPEAVGETEDGILTLAYGNIVGLLVESIKDLKSEVDLLKSEIQDIRKG